MRAKRASALLCACMALTPNTVAAQGWVEPMTALRAAPVALEDPRAPLAARIALARALGRHGPERDAVKALLATLQREPPPALRDEVLRALARRAPAAARAPLLARLRAKGAKPPELGLALAAIADREIAAALVDALGRAEDASLARTALLAMRERAATALAEASSGPHAAVALELLRELGPAAVAARLPLERTLAGDDAALALRAQEPSGALASAALQALAGTATRAEAPLLLKLATRGEPEQRALALRALAHAAPEQAAPLLASALGQPHAELREAARESLLADTPDASFVAPLAKLARQRDEAAASALARVPGGRGVPALLAWARAGAADAERSARPLALALRSHGHELDEALVAGARAVLRALPAGPRRAQLRSLARDPEPAQADPAALALSAGASQASALVAALEHAQEPELARRLCDAARALGARPSPRALDRLVRDPATAPEALTLWASLEAAQPSRALRVALRRALDPRAAPCTRAAAALALGAQLARGDVTAEVPLIALLADPVPRLRLAAALGLRASSTPRATFALAQHARIERDARVRTAFARSDARGHGTDPTQALELRVLTDDGAPRLLEVWLDDGRCLRQRTLPGGELVIAGLPAGEADVRVVE